MKHQETSFFLAIAFSLIGVFACGAIRAQDAKGGGDGCISQPLMKLFVEHRFSELEIAFRKMLQEATARGDVATRICSRHFLGGVQGRLEKYEEALGNLRAALEDAKSNLPPDHAQILDGQEVIASVLGKSGDQAASIKAFKELLPIYERKYRPVSEKVANLLRNLATANAWVGNHDEVVRLDRQVLKIKRQLAQTSVGDFWKRNRIPEVAHAELHLAEALLSTPGGSIEAAKLAEMAIPEMVSILGANHPQTLNARLVVALAMARSGDLAESMNIVDEVVRNARAKLGQAHPVTRKAENDFALHLAAAGRSAEALELDRQRAASLAESQGAAHPETLLAYSNLSVKLVSAQRFDEAVAVAEKGLQGAMTVRRKLAFDSRLSVAWQGSMRRMIESYLYALMAKKRYVDAFLVMEFFKTRLLADRLTLDVDEFSLPVTERKRYRTLLQNLSRIEQELAVRRSLKQSVAELEVRRLHAAELATTAIEARRTSDSAEAMPNSRNIPSWANMATVLANENTAYVSFLRVHGRLYGMSFARDGQLLFASLGPVSRLRPLIKAVRHLMQPNSAAGSNPTKVWKTATGDLRIGSQNGGSDREIRAPDELLEEISKIVIGQLEPVIAGRTQIVFSTDDMLAHVPFAALPYRGKALIESFSLSMVPSLEVLQRVRGKAHLDRGTTPLPMLAIGGARYQRIERVAQSVYIQHESPSVELMDLKIIRQFVAGDPKRLPLALSSFAIGLPNLPGSEDEAKQIALAFGGEKRGARLLIGPAATEGQWNALAASGELARYRNIHIAAHGFLSDDDSALSAIVLGQAQREPGTDGYLTAAEISTIDLGSDLVVVSACNSGVSEFVEGEGTQGLAYALFEAGTRHAMLSLWPISDKATVAFMNSFYKAYSAGRTQTAALAAAQRWAIAQGWPARDWGAFVMHGN